MKLGAFIVPTGIGASIGGYAGDASLYAKKIAQHCKLIVNPNVVNAACFSGISENMLYTEGFIVDEFFKGNINLVPYSNNKIGVVFDKSIPQNVLNVHINTINAVKIVYGIDVAEYIITEEEVGVEFFVDKNGFSSGDVKNLDTIKQACQNLIEKGVEAIAVICHFPESDSDEYANGCGIDPVGGVEAIISHYISKEFLIPCAHAPAFSDISIPTQIVHPKCAAEFITPTFLPCILIGLSQAPKISKSKEIGYNIEDLDFLITPYDSMGGVPMLEANKRNIKIYCVKENITQLNVTPDKFSIKCDIINTYEELSELLKDEKK